MRLTTRKVDLWSVARGGLCVFVKALARVPDWRLFNAPLKGPDWICSRLSVVACFSPSKHSN